MKTKIGYDFPKIDGHELSESRKELFRFWREKFQDSLEMVEKLDYDNAAHNCAFEVVAHEIRTATPNSINDYTLPYGSIETQVKYLQGKVLTVIDASFSDERQLKAVKDLVNKTFSEQLDWIYEVASGHPPRGSASSN